MRKPWHAPLFWSGILFLSQAFRLPSPVRNAATADWVSGYSLYFPPSYLVFAPFYGIADRLTLLSYHQIIAALVYVIIAGMVLFGMRRWFMALFAFILFVAWSALAPRPMAKLVAPSPDTLLIDFHSHSEVSHDGRKGFSADANRQWHRKQGYNAAFITDHNKIDSSQKAKELSRTDWQTTGYRSLEGEEISLWKTHLVTLGVPERIDNRPYDSDPRKVSGFIQDMQKKKIPVIASLPEYWFYHWPVWPPQWNDASYAFDPVAYPLMAVQGFEIINSAPKALDFPPAYRRQIVDWCQKNNLFMTGISDTHGYGITAVWNAMHLPGWQQLDPDQLQAAVLSVLRTKGFHAVEVLERVRYNPENVLEVALAPMVNAVLYWRGLSTGEAISWVAWTWLAFGIRRRLKQSHA